MAKTKVIKPARTVQKKAVKEPKKVDFVEKVAKETKKPEPVKPELKKRRGLITKPLKKKEVDSKKFKSINGFYVPRKFNAEKVKKEILEQVRNEV
uniref:60S ribosomal protein L6 n=1 Tax=Bursaphelenchus xylophilus TaxID=6326 RepID=A0A1I7SBE9_BURXY